MKKILSVRLVLILLLSAMMFNCSESENPVNSQQEEVAEHNDTLQEQSVTDSTDDSSSVMTSKESLLGGDIEAVFIHSQSDYYSINNPIEYPIIVNPDGDVQDDQSQENQFLFTADSTKSTFSIDVDNASYTYARSIIENGAKPDESSIRIEEFINYFDYDYPAGSSRYPFSIHTAAGECPWNSNHNLVHIGIKGKEIAESEILESNIVLLIDVSGSMAPENRLPLAKSAFINMIDNYLDENDYVSIVTYAGQITDILEPLACTPSNKQVLISFLEDIHASGSTAGALGIQTAYEHASRNFIQGGNNRVVLATDGDFNVGITNRTELVSFIEDKRETGIYLSILGFGMGGRQETTMELLTNAGNGNYFYIDNLREGERVLGRNLRSNLNTIAEDVKVQIDFNANVVKRYRLIGYENRVLANRDFDNDAVDAGEIGPGHTVTALYEIELYENSSNFSQDIYSVELRYKNPGESESNLIQCGIEDVDVSQLGDIYWFSAAVAQFGLLLKNSQFKTDASFDSVIELAQDNLGTDLHGDRSEFLSLVERARLIFD